MDVLSEGSKAPERLSNAIMQDSEGTRMYIPMHKPMHVDICMYTHIHIHKHINAHTQNTHVCIYIYVYNIYIHNH